MKNYYILLDIQLQFIENSSKHPIFRDNSYYYGSNGLNVLDLFHKIRIDNLISKGYFRKHL